MSLRIVAILLIATSSVYSQSFTFPFKEGHLSLISKVGLIPKHATTRFIVKSLERKDLNDINIIAMNGSITHDGTKLTINVKDESFIYLLAVHVEEGGKEIKYYDLAGLPIASSDYPYIAVYADNIPITPSRGVIGNTQKISMELLHNELQGSCKNVFVNQIAVAFTDRQRAVGTVRDQGNEVLVGRLFQRGASPHLQITVKAESIGCTDKNGVLKTIRPKINRVFTYGITASNIDKDVVRIIRHLNEQNKRQPVRN